MMEEPDRAADDFPLHTDLAARLDPAAPAATEAESRTRGMLRDAIKKVMAEITHHENEAKKHKQQAEELRRELRESFAFVQLGRDKGKPPEPIADIAESRKAKEPAADEKAPRGGAKKRPAGKK
jgi:hypothetical protein